MLNVQQTITNLVGIEVTEDLQNDIICAFDTTEEEIIISESNVGYQAYENRQDAPIIVIQIENNKIVDAWED
ncbi:MAG: hypothetical protein WCR54_08560 [Clostridia bacterium]